MFAHISWIKPIKCTKISKKSANDVFTCTYTLFCLWIYFISNDDGRKTKYNEKKQKFCKKLQKIAKSQNE